jgi:hypothetical protein
LRKQYCSSGLGIAETAAAARLKQTTAVAAVQVQVVLAAAIEVQTELQAAARRLAKAARHMLRMAAMQHQLAIRVQ